MLRRLMHLLELSYMSISTKSFVLIIGLVKNFKPLDGRIIFAQHKPNPNQGVIWSPASIFQ